MATAMQVGSKMIQIEEVPSLLQRYQLISQVLRGLVIDQAIADITCNQEEYLAATAEFEKQHQITSPEVRSAWLQNQVMTLEQMEEIAIRPVKIEKFKTATWGHKVGSYFLTRKASLDQVVYSLIRTKDAGLAHELYFRIQEGEESFAELARNYSQGTEADTGGLLGPVPLTHPHPMISKLLSVSQAGQLWPPRIVSEWFVIVRSEKLFPAQLDESMRRRLINELFETWLEEQIKEVEP
jgi:parvulin-like peptidyl-prolyl isomerase